MSKKDFKIARKPGQGTGAQTEASPTPVLRTRTRQAAPVVPIPASAASGPTTRKTIEVPEDYFRRVKIRAVERGMLEKELWSEILGEYFKTHPTA